MRGAIWKLAVVLTAIASAVFAANMFMAAPGNPTAAQAVMLVGVAIFAFTFLLAAGGIVAGAWQAMRDLRETRNQANARRLEEG